MIPSTLIKRMARRLCDDAHDDWSDGSDYWMRHAAANIAEVPELVALIEAAMERAATAHSTTAQAMMAERKLVDAARALASLEPTT